MATTRSFADMLNEYLPYDLLREELQKRNYAISRIKENGGLMEDWKGGTLIVPFRGAQASTITYGGLAGSSDIAESNYVRGEVSGHKEAWGSMIFNERDLMEHDVISEQNLLRLLPDEIDQFMDFMSNAVSVNLLNGRHFATLTSDATANDGTIVVDHPERFEIGQKVIVDDDDSAAQTGYVSSINMNTSDETGTIVLVTTRGGATVVDFSAATMEVAQNARVYNDGAETAANAFTSMRAGFLSAGNGGDATLYGQTKTAFPYLQAIESSGATITAANIVEKCFDHLTTISKKGKGRPTDIVMSYKNFGSVLKAVEASKGAFNVRPESMKASQYGWDEIEVGSVSGRRLKFVGVQEMDNDIIDFVDWRGVQFHTHKMFKKRMDPHTNSPYFTIRNTTGYQYIVDICIYGELVVSRPSYQGILHSIDY